MDKQRVDGKLYSIPCMQQMVSYVSSLDFPIDIYEKYKDKINMKNLPISSHQRKLWIKRHGKD